MGKEGKFIDSGNILQLVFTTESSRIGEVEVHLPLQRCYHCTEIFEYAFQLGQGRR